MLKKHQELLETIQAAEKQARKLYAAGAGVDMIVRRLVNLGVEVKERVREYERAEKATGRAPVKAAAKAEAEKEAAG
jgi:hypothetical protein